ncbi:MAG: hypothetical protein V4565_05345 [Bacteroidota bacterium]
MKKIITVLFICVYSLTSFGQDTVKTKIKEYYLTLADFSPVTLQLKYKRQIVKKTYFKIGLVSLGYSENSQVMQDPNLSPSFNTYYSGGLELGIEFRKHLTKKFSLFHGPNLSFIYNESISRRQDPLISPSDLKSTVQTYRFSIPYSLGILFNVNSNILVAAEINPNISFNHQAYNNNYTPYSNVISENLSAGVDNRLVLLSIVYRL